MDKAIALAKEKGLLMVAIWWYDPVLQYKRMSFNFKEQDYLEAINFLQEDLTGEVK